jgi:hypothetical protein
MFDVDLKIDMPIIKNGKYSTKSMITLGTCKLFILKKLIKREEARVNKASMNT